MTGALLNALDVLVGFAFVVLVMGDIFFSVIVPRPVRSRLRVSFHISRQGWRLWRWFSNAFVSDANREDVLGTFAPAMLVTLSTVWVILLIFGYGLMFFGLRAQVHDVESFGSALYFAGTSLLTIGFGDIVPTGPATRILSVAAGATGFSVVAVITTFLFSIFGSFQTREAFILTFGARGGSPPSAVDLILGAAKLGMIDRVLGTSESALFWMAQVLETHLAYPVLIYFRSTHDGLSWIGTLGALLDSATLVLTTLEHPQSGEAGLVLHLGRHVVDDIANYFVLRDTGATGIERSEFDQAYEKFQHAGLRLRDQEAAWKAFSTTRAGYASRLNQMATYLQIPPQQWISDRSLLIGHQRSGPPLIPAGSSSGR